MGEAGLVKKDSRVGRGTPAMSMRGANKGATKKDGSSSKNKKW